MTLQKTANPKVGSGPLNVDSIMTTAHISSSFQPTNTSTDLMINLNSSVAAVENNLVVVDSGLEQLDVLLGGLAPNTQVLRIDRSDLALPLITDCLKQGEFDRMSILAHGSPGSIHLGRVFFYCGDSLL